MVGYLCHSAWERLSDAIPSILSVLNALVLCDHKVKRFSSVSL